MSPNASAGLLGGELHGTLDGVEVASVARVESSVPDSVFVWVPATADHGLVSIELQQFARIAALAPGMSMAVSARGCAGTSQADCVLEDALGATVRVEAAETPLLRHVVLSTQWPSGRGHVDGAFNFRATGTTLIMHAGMAGAMGEIEASDVATATYQGRVLQLDVHQNASHGWIMVRMALVQPLESLSVGSQETSSSIGCSGPTDGHYTFGSQSSGMTVRVDPTADPGAFRLTFAGRWMNDSTPQDVTGTVDYRVQ
jgi:hypothetical protein